MQIRTKLTIQFILVVTFIIAFCFSVLYYSSSNYRRNEYFQRLESKAANNFEMFKRQAYIDSAMLGLFKISQKDKLPRENIRIYSEQGKLLYNSNDSNLVNINSGIVQEVLSKGKKEYTVGPFEMLGVRKTEGAQNYLIFVCAVDRYGLSKLNNLRVTMLLLFFLIISMVAFAGWIYAGRALKPLSTVINDVEKIDVERLDVRLQSSTNHDEIGRLIDTFNYMLERVEKSVKVQRLFVSGASHELKNPLTTITSQLQVVMLNERSNEEYKTIIVSIIEDIRKLNRTTLDLIEYARLSYGDEIQFSPLRLDDVVWYCRDNFLNNNPSCQVMLSFDDMPEDDKELVIMGNEALLKVAFNNLIDNACKFSENHTCKIRMKVHQESLTVAFSDSGKGLNEEEISLVFEPFYRANNTAEIKGHGIGLALTKKIVEVHKGKITVQSKVGMGAEFSLSFLKR